MSKKKLLIHEVFSRIKKSSEKNTKGGLASDLSSYLDEKLGFIISKRTLIRYYEAYIESDEDIDIELYILNRLSQYLEFDDYDDFSTTIIKEGEDASKTTIKVDVDNNPLSSTNDISRGVVINISNSNDNKNDNKNDQHFKMPEFIKQNGLGILEITFVLLLVTGGVVFSNGKKEDKKQPFSFGFLSNGKPDIEKNYMYWNGERYVGTDSSYISPEFEVVAMDKKVFRHQRKIIRKDTLTLANSLGKVWCSKWNNEVDFFTMDGINPDNGRELKLASDHMILKYAGREIDSLQTEE
ncbi:hypothetical protein ASG22_11185 [Chryseobacterium sp. Leaf405]|uniref:hypothetical protein n=1 Tax=Chryseobacterium sp. Leaf405 TaxID=1736367 RepID=UPI000700EA51|nr:hypothetical protein [Chryseobacterium sp. Leaf405]KQT24552.1 hypothetical protein ASG22_11185 [Chryseobacterium sp. Leaf405]